MKIKSTRHSKTKPLIWRIYFDFFLSTCWPKPVLRKLVSKTVCNDGASLLGGSGGVVNSLDFYPALPLSYPQYSWLFLLPVRTFLTMEGGHSEFAKFTSANLKGIFEGPYSECVLATSKNLFSCYRMQKNKKIKNNSNNNKKHAFSPKHSLSSGQPKNNAKTLFFHHLLLSPVILPNTTVLAFVLLRNSRFSFHCSTQREATPTQKSADRKWQLRLSRLLARKITKGIHSCKPASPNCPIQDPYSTCDTKHVLRQLVSKIICNDGVSLY